MLRKLGTALRTAFTLGALIVLTGLHDRNKTPGTGNTGGSPAKRKRTPPAGKVGASMKSQTKRAKSRKARPEDAEDPGGRKKDPNNPHSRDYGSQVPYNRGELGEAAFNFRRDHGISPGQNVAVARLKNGELVYGVSQGKDKGYKWHSEDDILAKVDPNDIDSIYSERQPCSPCESNLTPPLTSDQVTYSVPWYDNKILNQVSNDMLAEMIDNAYRGR